MTNSRMPQIQSLLDYISGYIAMTNEETDFIVDIAQLHVFKKNEIIHEQNNRVSMLGFILKGGVRAFYLNDEGEEHTIEFYYENEILGDYNSLMKKQQTEASIQALERTKLIAITYRDFLTFLNRFPRYLNVLSEMLSESISQVTERSKLLRISSSRERYEAFCTMRPKVAQRAPLTYIASYLGMALGTLSRVRAGKL
ncbi:MAG: Crp/Fnr family transcriptional regulator [Bacteroidetes bacterium]|nr:Crp/Fnr family transcriptional regulator [Bacteroidota bacterium]